MTLVIWSNLVDPFNAPKSWVMFVVGAYLAGWVTFQFKAGMKESVLKLATFLSAGFIFTLLLAFIFTDQKYIGFFGENARKTGFLTYFSLTVFFLSSSYLFRLSNLSKFNLVILVVGPIVAGYGFCQHFKVDVITWNNPYNSVLSTLGNPDFASAVMAIFLVLTAGVTLNQSIKTWIRLWGLLSAALLGITIVFSQARQGLLASFVGLGVIFSVFLFQRHRIAGFVGIGFAGFAMILGVLGMLNTGPLAKYLYKMSVTYRGDYWRAGINMFKHHILFGVGLDRYGAYFRQYRDATQSLRRGPNLLANAAHNVPIQLAATGGIFVVVVFISIFVFVAWRALVAIRSTSGGQQLVVASVVGAWVTYEVQSFISIDNVGIAIWGWILGGFIVGISLVESIPENSTTPVNAKNAKRTNSRVNSSDNALLQPLVSGIAATVALALVIPLFLADTQARLAPVYAKPTSANLGAYIAAVKKPLSYGIQDPANKVLVGNLLVQTPQITEGIKILKSVIASDPRNSQALDMLATIAEQTDKKAEAVPYRRAMVKLDPYNQEILLKLGQDLKASGDLAGAKAIIPLIDAFASNTPEAALAKAEFGA